MGGNSMSVGLQIFFEAFFGFIALVTLVMVIIKFLYPICLQRRNKKILEDEFARGPYDRTTIERSTRYYIQPKCSNIDPAQEKEIRHAFIATKEDLFSKVDIFLDYDNAFQHLLILADSGTGKTSFVLNYYVHNYRRRKYKCLKRIGHPISIVPLGIQDADRLIDAIPNKREKAIFLDAFDEDVKAITDHKLRIENLVDKCRDFRKVIITCRTQFFPKDEEIPTETGILKLGPTKAGESHTYEFWKLYLSPFDDNDVKHFLKKRYPIWKYRTQKKARDIALKIPLLTARPMLLAHIPDIIDQGTKIERCSQLYETMVDAWLERETAWVNKDALRDFSERLAVDIFLKRQLRGTECITIEALSDLGKQWEIEIPDWQLSGRSLLNRDAAGNYKFAHRSIMEYLFAVRLIHGDPQCCGIKLTDQMKKFLIELLIPSLRKPIKMVFQDILDYPIANLDVVAKTQDYIEKNLTYNQIYAGFSGFPYRDGSRNPKVILPEHREYRDESLQFDEQELENELIWMMTNRESENPIFYSRTFYKRIFFDENKPRSDEGLLEVFSKFMAAKGFKDVNPDDIMKFIKLVRMTNISVATNIYLINAFGQIRIDIHESEPNTLMIEFVPS
jgi:hypothetical protein